MKMVRNSFWITHLDRLVVSSCWIACILDGVCFSKAILSIPGVFISLDGPWKPADEITPPVPEFMFWSTLVWLVPVCPSLTRGLGVGVIGDARPIPCWISGLERWFPVWLFVRCWYRLPCDGTAMFGDAVAGVCWFETIADTVELLLLLLLLLFVVGNWIPGTVAEDNGTDTTRLSGCCCRSSFDFAWMFCVITCDLLLLARGEVAGDAVWWDVDALVTVVDPVEWITLGLTFWMFGSWVGAVTTAADVVDWGSVRAWKQEKIC